MTQDDRNRIIANNDEQLLSEYGAQLRVRNAAPSARLAQQIARAALADVPSTRPARRFSLDWLLSSRRGLALSGSFAALGIMISLYVLFGGRPTATEVLATASSSGAQVAAKHSGVFGLTWHLPLGFDAAFSAALAQGDEIKTDANTTVTLTFQSGTRALISPNSVARIESLAPLQLVLLHGEVVNLVEPAITAGQPALQVLTQRGEYTARGTVYDVQVASIGDRVKTRAGSVGAQTTRSAQVVDKGQEAQISDSGLITRYLSAPEVTLSLPNAPPARGGDAIFTNAGEGSITVSTAAGAQIDALLEASDGTSNWLSVAQADARGMVTLSLTLPAREGDVTLIITATDTSADQLGSAAALPIRIGIDSTPPQHFRLSEPANLSVTSSPARIVGETEPDTVMTINGAAVNVGANGSFSADVPLSPGANRIEFAITDRAGNTLRIEQFIELK